MPSSAEPEREGRLEDLGGEPPALEDSSPETLATPPVAEKPRSRMRSILGTVLKWLLLLVAVAFLARELISQWEEVRSVLLATPWWAIVLAIVLAMGAVTASGEQQRGLLRTFGYDISPAEWFRVFFTAQLGKYVPGTAWAYVSQMELSKQKGVTRSTSVVTILLGSGMTVLASFLFGLVSLPFATVGWLPVWLRALAGVAGAIGLIIITVRPQWMGIVLERLPERFAVGTVALRTIRPLWWPSAWTLVASLLYGLHTLALAWSFGVQDAQLVLLSIGGFATAWVVGFLAFIVPAGVGVREVVLAGFLGPVVGQAAALSLVVLSRFLIIVAEALLLASTPFLGRHLRRAGRTEDGEPSTRGESATSA